jgi:hypothetical protein
LEEKRLLIEHSLETGRMYLREEKEEKRTSSDSGEGSQSGKLIVYHVFAELLPKLKMALQVIAYPSTLELTE